MNTVWLKTTQSEHVNKKLATQYVLNFMHLSLTHPIITLNQNFSIAPELLHNMNQTISPLFIHTLTSPLRPNPRKRQ